MKSQHPQQPVYNEIVHDLRCGGYLLHPGEFFPPGAKWAVRWHPRGLGLVPDASGNYKLRLQIIQPEFKTLSVVSFVAEEIVNPNDPKDINPHPVAPWEISLTPSVHPLDIEGAKIVINPSTTEIDVPILNCRYFQLLMENTGNVGVSGMIVPLFGPN